jgi:hypothetical protein
MIEQNDGKKLIGNALGFAFSSLFERGFSGFFRWFTVTIVVGAITVLLLFALVIINRFTGFAFFTTNFTQRPDGTWAPPSPYFILTFIWMYVMLIPSIHCVLLDYYDTNTLQLKSLLSFFSVRKLFSFFVISIIPALFVHKAVQVTTYISSPLETPTPLVDYGINIPLPPIIVIMIQILLSPLIRFIIGIILASRLMFAGYYIIDKNDGPLEALGASWNLTKGRVFKFLGLTITMTTIFVLFTSIQSSYATREICTLIGYFMIGLMTVYAYRQFEKKTF